MGMDGIAGRGSDGFTPSELATAHIRINVGHEHGHDIKTIRLDQLKDLGRKLYAEAKGSGDIEKAKEHLALIEKVDTFYAKMKGQSAGGTLDMQAHTSSQTGKSRFVGGELKKSESSEKVTDVALQSFDSLFNDLKNWSLTNSPSLREGAAISDFHQVAHENTALRSENVSNRIALAQSAGQIQDLMDQVDRLGHEKSKLMQSQELLRNNFDQKCRALEGDVGKLTKEKERFALKTLQLGVQLDRLNADIDSKQREISTLKEQMNSLRSNLSDSEGARKIAEGRVNALEGDLRNVKSERDSAQKDLRTTRDLLAKTQKKLGTSEQEQSRQRSRAERAESNLAEAMRTIATLQREKEELGRKVSTLEGENKALGLELKESKSMYANVEASRKGIAGTLARTSSQLREKIGELSQALEEKGELAKEVKQFQVEMEAKIEENSTLDERLGEARKVVGTLSEKVNQLTREASEKDQQMGVLDSTNRSLSAELSQVKKELAEAKSAQASLQHALTEEKGQHTETKRRLSAAESTVHNQAEALEVASSDLSTRTTERDTAKRELSEERVAHRSTKSELEEAQESNSTLLQSGAEQAAKIRSLEEAAVGRDAEIAELQSDLSEAKEASQVTVSIDNALFKKINTNFQLKVKEEEGALAPGSNSTSKMQLELERFKQSEEYKSIVHEGGPAFSKLWERINKRDANPSALLEGPIDTEKAKLVILKASMEALSIHAAKVAVSKIDPDQFFRDHIAGINAKAAGGDGGDDDPLRMKSADFTKKLIMDVKAKYLKLLDEGCTIPSPREASNIEYNEIDKRTGINLGRSEKEQGYANGLQKDFDPIAHEHLRRFNGDATEAKPTGHFGAPIKTLYSKNNNYSNDSGKLSEGKLTHFQAVHAAVLANIYYTSDRARDFTHSEAGESSPSEVLPSLQITPNSLKKAQDLLQS